MTNAQMKENGFFRVAAGVPSVRVADVACNVAQIIDTARRAGGSDAAVLVLPELCITSYTAADLFRQRPLLDAAEAALTHLAEELANVVPMVVVGAPLRCRGALYNCAVVLAGGRIVGVVPKTYLPSNNEFYEKRWFASGLDIEAGATIDICGGKYPFGRDLLFRIGEATVGIELCEDLWVPAPPSAAMAVAGADVILNLSASDETIGKHRYLMGLIAQQSARCRCAYVYASAGYGESTTDVVYAGNAIIAEDGAILRESPRFTAKPQLEVADIDLWRLSHDRLNSTGFHDCSRTNALAFRTIDTGAVTPDKSGLLRKVERTPFVPASDALLDSRCREIVDIQSEGLMRRLDVTHSHSLVVGISGGLDSTLALLVAVRAFDRLGLDRKGITGITMPGFGTTGRTYRNALTLMHCLGISTAEIPIAAAVRQHFSDIGQSEDIHDITYENSQARERTQILMDYANKTGGMVLGTGDLSELALGWCTYNGDHMSMYAVNASVPKTLVRYLVAWFASDTQDKELRRALLDIADTPVSPELIPADENDNIVQKTEDAIGPYELHDFFLYHVLRYGFPPRRIYMMALKAFEGVYTPDVIHKWLTGFYRRFFTQQFKRSCMPDGPKVGSVCLSPRGDWRMPSDASAALWLSECETLNP